MTVSGLLAAAALGGCTAFQSPPPAWEASANARRDSLAAPLTRVAGDARRGREVFQQRERGHCVMCHRLDSVAPAGDFGPALAGVGARFDAGQLRQRVVDITVVNAAAAMPAFYRREGLNRVDRRDAAPLLTAQEVEDVVAFLVTLR